MLFGLLVGCTAPAPVEERIAEGEAPHVIYAVRHGWHTGIVVRSAEVPAGAWAARRDFPHAKYLEVGWGDRDYYRDPSPGPLLALKAILAPSPGVLHMVAFSEPVVRYFPESEIVELRLSQSGLERLIDYVSRSHELDEGGRAIPMGQGRYGESGFYASRDTFHLFRTCNVWTAQALQEAGLPVKPEYSVTSDQLMYQLRRLGKVIREAPPEWREAGRRRTRRSRVADSVTVSSRPAG
jgi:uncharacterized protein (TIGR02117 family)